MAKQSRGVDRVPKHLQVRKPDPAWIHRNELTRPGLLGEVRTGPSYVNPHRDGKSLRSGRLRKELRP